VAHQPAGADEGEQRRVEQIALQRAADRVRPVEHDDLLAEPGGFLEAVAQRRDEGVDAAADVLEVDQERIDVGEHRGGRPARVGVERVHGDAERRVAPVRRLDHVVLLLAEDAVLRREERREAPAAFRDEIAGVTEPAVDGGLVAEQAEPPSRASAAAARKPRGRW
jgi:hypothetical protein